MSVIYLLIPIAIIFVVVAIFIFRWAVKSNQFNDLDKQGYSILFDDDVKKTNQENTDHNVTIIANNKNDTTNKIDTNHKS
ncbi:cbb3-type cytochrome oxidase assembly protein CcoS [Flocculibacter collagenilyticus]|uniref:cbb3-type cytochrome oxidase assembly protein CcoS n=1 Tax=Flocculibacter collagenilyticus TaxID=2744479 RepID=UPI0018F331ED|nr:cbb3-type cytochrome oxidase assembly protein CcoS [Flocculibacter collagenilyticus]